LLAFLPQRGKKRRRYGTKRAIKQGWTRHVRPIEQRSAGANNRSRLRHFEGDTVRLKGGALLTHTDRKSRFEIVHLVKSEEAEVAYEAIINDCQLSQAKSITYDRGSTFAWWRMIEKSTGSKVFFANAHHPWERGTNENGNQRLRRCFPKGTKYSNINDEAVARNVWIMNHTKRKCLNWRTPCQVFKGCCTSN
jgi:IS30 family transposase